MKKFLILFFLISPLSLTAPSKLKDLVSVKGVRDNPLIGYGVVIGLNGTGDGGGEIINNSLKLMFQKLGLNPQREISSKNVASVIVTAKLPPFARVGQKIDVTISSIGDASSLAGGTLLVTPLKGGDGKVYAVANGALSIGGIEQGQKFPTTGLIVSGGTVEKEIDINFNQKNSIRLTLHNPDFTTNARIQKTINKELGGKYAISRDSATVDIIVPIHYKRKVVQLLAIIENFEVHSDTKAKIVINERTGTIIAGGNIKLRPVAISHGDLTVEVSDGDKKEDGASNSLLFLKEKATLNDLVKGLNTLGATPEDLISIFQGLKRNGSLIGEIEII